MNAITITDTNIQIKNRLDSQKNLLLHAQYWGDHRVTTPSQLADTRSRAPTQESQCKSCVRHLTSNFYTGRQDTFSTNTPIRESTANKTHRITYRPTRKSTNTGNANRLTRHEKDFSNRALWKPHRDASRLKPTWWHTFLTLQHVNLQDTYASTLVAFLSTSCWQS